MSAAARWARGADDEPLPAERTLADAEPTSREDDERPLLFPREDARPTVQRPPLDLDQVQTLAWSVVGAVLYLLGVLVAGFGLAVAFGWWAGGLLVLLAGGVPSGYSLVTASARRAERERRAHFEARQERTNHDALTRAIELPR